MNKTSLESAYASISRLVEDFEKNKHHYMDAKYSEQAARHDFIDKQYNDK
jgi:hypothetical protein